MQSDIVKEWFQNFWRTEIRSWPPQSILVTLLLTWTIMALQITLTGHWTWSIVDVIINYLLLSSYGSSKPASEGCLLPRTAQFCQSRYLVHFLKTTLSYTRDNKYKHLKIIFSSSDNLDDLKFIYFKKFNEFDIIDLFFVNRHLPVAIEC